MHTLSEYQYLQRQALNKLQLHIVNSDKYSYSSVNTNYVNVKYE